MSAKEKIKELLEASEDGIITTAQVVEAPRYFTGVCQKWRDIPFGAWHICAEQCMGG